MEIKRYSTHISKVTVAFHFLQDLYCSKRGWIKLFDSSKIPVSAMRAPTIYGSISDAGLLSSIYPFFSAAVLVGILKEAALFPTP